MSILEKISVKYVDNELIILASTGSGSLEICHIKSGYKEQTPLNIYLGAILPVLPDDQSYNLIVIGINWGGQTSFDLELTWKDAPTKSLKGPSDNTDKIGCVWCSDDITFSVVTPN